MARSGKVVLCNRGHRRLGRRRRGHATNATQDGKEALSGQIRRRGCIPPVPTLRIRSGKRAFRKDIVIKTLCCHNLQ